MTKLQAFLLPVLMAACASPRVHEAQSLWIGVYDGYGAGAWAQPGNWIEAMGAADVAPIRSEAIREGELQHFDFVLFLADLASEQFHALGAGASRQAMKRN